MNLMSLYLSMNSIISIGENIYIIMYHQLVTNIAKLFADDTSIFLTLDYPAMAAGTLNGDLNAINIWSLL